MDVATWVEDNSNYSTGLGYVYDYWVPLGLQLETGAARSFYHFQLHMLSSCID